MIYFVSAFKVGVKSFPNFTVVMFDVIASSVLSINLVITECLNALSNCPNVVAP